MTKNAAQTLAKKPKRVISQMTFVGVLVWATGAVRMHKDGDGFKSIWRVWHPVTWLMAVIMVLPCAVTGVALKEVFPLRISKFWQEHADQLQFVMPWTRLDSLKPFKSNIRIPREITD